MRSPRLHCYVAVAEVLLFWHAPERLRVVLLAVSEQVRKLKEELAVQLFTRDQRTVRVDCPVDVLREPVVHTLGRFAREPPEVEVPNRQRDPYAVEGVCRRLVDVAAMYVPAPLAAPAATPTGVEQVVAAIPDAFPGAAGVLPLSRLTDPASVVLPREIIPPFYNGLVSATRSGSIVVPFDEVRVPSVQCALLTAPSHGAPAQLPSSEVERYHLSRMRFVAVAHPATPTTVAGSTVEDIHAQHQIQIAVAHAAQAEPAEFRHTTVDRVA